MFIFTQEDWWPKDSSQTQPLVLQKFKVTCQFWTRGYQPTVLSCLCLIQVVDTAEEYIFFLSFPIFHLQVENTSFLFNSLERRSPRPKQRFFLFIFNWAPFRESQNGLTLLTLLPEDWKQLLYDFSCYQAILSAYFLSQQQMTFSLFLLQFHS